jgi:acetyl esterase/lipase
LSYFYYNIIGGHAVAVVSQRLLEEKQPQPKLQILIYPWTQMVNMYTASNIYYKQKSAVPMPFAKIVSWYLGIKDIKQEIIDAFVSHNYTLLFDNYDKYLSLMDVKKIPKKYKTGRSYYDNYENRVKHYMPNHKLDKTNILVKDKKINSLFKKLSNKDFSPLLAEDKFIFGLPKAYFILLEWDAIKDEGILYAERLREKGVEVKIAFYENAFHGIANLIDVFEIARQMQTDLIEYLKSGS